MSANRLLNVVIALVLAVVAALTVYNVRATTALTQADRAYDPLEQVRAQRLDTTSQVDRSYDAIENQRVEASLAMADHSYDQVESVRIQRNAVVADRSYDRIEDLRALRILGR